jgi:16S rRNA (guanine966-N2)-methyltransferase
VQSSTVATFLAGKSPDERPFDVVFLDPPYGTTAVEVTRVLASLGESGWLASRATIVLERSSEAGPVPTPESWQTTWERSYGDTLVTVLSTTS